jgi:hypothetical protein
VNQFLSEHTFDFGPSPTFRRVFNNGDQADFDWNQGGRLISGGKDSYQQWKSERRKDIKIDGEDVVELDFRSSQPPHLTLGAIFQEWTRWEETIPA